MRQKELRLALVCYGGVSLAVYMHGVTKEVWHLARASRAHLDADRNEREEIDGVAGVYRDLLARIESEQDLRLRVLPDILTGASAGGINAVFLAQALYSGGSLEPVTDLWLKNADVTKLTAREARPGWRFAKFWAQPFADWLLRRGGNAVDETVSPETRKEVREKVSSLVRGRWFGPPFSGERFSEMLFEALQSMEDTKPGPVLLPPSHPVNLLVTATDFRGHAETLRLNSPAKVEETEHRMPIAFEAKAPIEAGGRLADLLELVLAARATASFPGAFPPVVLDEIDRLAAMEGHHWATRGSFLSRIMPAHVHKGTVNEVALIDGAVLVNAPFGAALKAMKGRTSQREVDRRFVYIEPRPDRSPVESENAQGETTIRPLGWFSTIFGALSTIPREQPIRDDLERIEKQSRDAYRLRQIVMGLRPDIDRAVEKLFGRTFFLDSPTPKRLSSWRAKAQTAAADRAGYTFSAYAETKFSVILDRLAELTCKAAPGFAMSDCDRVANDFRRELTARGLARLCDDGGASPQAIAFFRSHDVGFRIRRLQLLARRLSRDWEIDPEIPDDALDIARSKIYHILSLYEGVDDVAHLGEEFVPIAAATMEHPGAALDFLARNRMPPEIDVEAENLLAEALADMPRNLKRRMLLTYLGFPFYDVATLPLLKSERLDEYNPVKIDRISPDDARSIREGGTTDTLRGTEFYNFGAFFSRSYRENDYIWGRLHGAERMIDLVVSTLETPMGDDAVRSAKRSAFLAILDEEAETKRCSSALIGQLRSEVIARLG